MQATIDTSGMSPEQIDEFNKLCCEGTTLWSAYDYARQTK